MVAVHLVFNAHLDPVWLWPWQAGLDEALATCRSACDRLDAHPDLVFVRGEAWVYRWVERLDPALFARIRAHQAAGRWAIVGGWWIQPDANHPTESAMRRQIELGKRFFLDRFGVFPREAYNVDTFGHASALPRLMRGQGQDRYVMMRPQEHEMALPARVFRWRGEPDGPAVTTFRIARAYTVRDLSEAHVLASLEGLPEGLGHTMCFVGVGDHGGGPTERQIAWCREHRNSIPGCRLEFSSPARFFDAVEDSGIELPEVVGELQPHAIGCYSVMRAVKAASRRAERLLEQVEAAGLPVPEEAAERVAFAQFHDTLGGTCLPSAYAQILDQLGHAGAVADDILQTEFRLRMAELPDDACQRIVAWNPSAEGFDGWLEHSPWLEWAAWDPRWSLIDEAGKPVPCELVRSEAMLGDERLGLARLRFRAQLPPNGMRAWRLAPGRPNAAALPAPDSGLFDRIRSGLSLELVEDLSDTWSHGLDAYSGATSEAEISPTTVQADGPLHRVWAQTAAFGRSDADLVWRMDAGEPYVDLELTVRWAEHHRLLKLRWSPRGFRAMRLDGVMGGWLARPIASERPIQNAVWLAGPGVVCPDAFAADGDVRLTLLRSPLMAHHDPHPGFAGSPRTWADQGTHTFRFRFFEQTDPPKLARHASMLNHPPLTADLTRGMPAE